MESCSIYPFVTDFFDLVYCLQHSSMFVACDRIFFKNHVWGTSLVIHWLRLHASNARCLSSIPGWGTGIPYVEQHGQDKQTNKQTKTPLTNKQTSVCVCITFSSVIYPLSDIWVASTSWLLWIILQWRWVCTFLHFFVIQWNTWWVSTPLWWVWYDFLISLLDI